VGSGMFGRVSTAGAKRKGRVVEDDDDENEDAIEDTNSKRNKTSDEDELEDSDEDLADDPLTAKPRKPPAYKVPAKRKPGRPVGRKEASPVAISDDERDPPPDKSLDEYLKAPVPSQSSDIPSIPRALLLRLMHEHFASKETKIDKHALVVLEKYFEIYIREAIARSLLAKKEDVEKGAASQGEERWLEKSDLEKIVAGVVMDF
jgi:hypothetical protein